MSVMLFKLRGAEEDEADDIRTLLDEHNIDYYETSNGAWGLGFAAIWLHSDEMYVQAKKLIDDYQVQRAAQAQEVYHQLCLEGKQPTWWDAIKTRPIQVLFTLIAVVIMVMFALTPFLFL